MSHSHLSDNAYKREPKSPVEWTDRWTRERVIWVPTRKGGTRHIKLQNVSPCERADLLMQAVDGRKFYVQFMVGRVYRPLDLPVLVWPVDRGVYGAFWVMPGAAAG